MSTTHAARHADVTTDGLRLARILDDVEQIAGSGFYAGRRRTITAGDIGEDQREVEFEPFPESAPVEQPVFVPESEPVPA